MTFPFRRILETTNIVFHMATVEKIDPHKRLVYTTSRPRKFDAADGYFGSLVRGGFPVERIAVENVDKMQLAKVADVVFVLVDLNPTTKHIVDKEFLAAMK